MLIEKLNINESNIGDVVTYHNKMSIELGRISSYNDKFVFIEFTFGVNACKYTDVYWGDRVSELRIKYQVLKILDLLNIVNYDDISLIINDNENESIINLDVIINNFNFKLNATIIKDKLMFSPDNYKYKFIRRNILINKIK